MRIQSIVLEANETDHLDEMRQFGNDVSKTNGNCRVEFMFNGLHFVLPLKGERLPKWYQEIP